MAWVQGPGDARAEAASQADLLGGEKKVSGQNMSLGYFTPKAQNGIRRDESWTILQNARI